MRSSTSCGPWRMPVYGMPMMAPSSVLSTIRTLIIQAPSPGRIDCQSLPPPGNNSPRRRSPSKRPPVMTPTRRSTPGVLPTLMAGATSSSSVNSGRTCSSVISGGRISDSGRVVDTGESSFFIRDLPDQGRLRRDTRVFRRFRKPFPGRGAARSEAQWCAAEPGSSHALCLRRSRIAAAPRPGNVSHPAP